MLDSDLVTYHAANRPNDDVSTIGGAITATVIPENSPGALFPSVAIPTLGNPDIVHRYKAFRKNTNATDTLGGPPRMWILNGLKLPASTGLVSLITTGTETGVVLVSGKVSGTPTSEYVSIAGPAGTYNTLNSYDSGCIIWVMALTASSGGVRQNVSNNLEVWRGTKLGMIPGPYNTGTLSYGFSTASAEYELGLDTAINGTLTTANRLTDPSGVTFSRPTQESEAILMPSSSNLTPSDAIGYWLRRTVVAGSTRPPFPITPTVILSGTV